MLFLYGPSGSGKSTLASSFAKDGMMIADLDLLSVHIRDEWRTNLVLFEAAVLQGITSFAGTSRNFDDVIALARKFSPDLTFMVLHHEAFDKVYAARNAKKGYARWELDPHAVRKHREDVLRLSRRHDLVYYVEPQIDALHDRGGSDDQPYLRSAYPRLAFPYPLDLRIGWWKNGTADSDPATFELAEFIDKNRGCIKRLAAQVKGRISGDLWDKVPGFKKLSDKLLPQVKEILAERTRMANSQNR